MKSRKTTTKEKILQAARQVLEKEGIKGLSQTTVAKQVGISQGQLTYHFKKRSDLILALTETTLDEIAEFIWSKSPGLSERTSDSFLAPIISLIKSKNRIRALLGLVIEADDDEEIRKQLVDRADKVRSLIALTLELSEESSEVTMLHALIMGYSLMFFVQDSPKKVAQLTLDFKKNIQLILYNLGRDQ